MIMDPIMGVAVFDSVDRNLLNRDKVSNLAEVATCMDQYTLVDETLVQGNLNQQKDVLDRIRITWYISIAFVAFEVLVLILVLLAMCCSKCRRNMSSRSYNRNAMEKETRREIYDPSNIDTMPFATTQY